jgi:hypothetical protein
MGFVAALGYDMTLTAVAILFLCMCVGLGLSRARWTSNAAVAAMLAAAMVSAQFLLLSRM